MTTSKFKKAIAALLSVSIFISFCPNLITYAAEALRVSAAINGNAKKWTKENVILSVDSASAGEIRLSENPYSFSSDKNRFLWQTDNTKVFTENQTVYVYIKDNANKATLVDTVKIDRIDKTPPAFCEMTQAKCDNIVTVSINNASDADSGLHEKAYSFNRTRGLRLAEKQS